MQTIPSCTQTEGEKTVEESFLRQPSRLRVLSSHSAYIVNTTETTYVFNRRINKYALPITLTK